ncbi:MAG: ATP-binding cassette domain-containing protein, partial [Mesorhizobium sp.]
VLAAMGMGERLAGRWSQANNAFREAQAQASDLTSGLGAASRIMRMMLQSMVLALGAYLVIYQQATPGIIIASSILTSRALAPIELATAYWKHFLSARQSWQRLVGYLPQDVELFAGTVAQNISRLDENAMPEAIIEASQAAGVHDMILRLPEGYQTEIGESGAALSAGQRQRVGLA